MGRWAQAARRGGVGPANTGLAPSPPGTPDWTPSPAAASKITFTETTAFPAGVSSFVAFYRLTGTVPWTRAGAKIGSPGAFTTAPLSATTAYDTAISWGDGSGVQSSQLSPVQNVTTT